jgi:AraC-like DNA-binding protein
MEILYLTSSILTLFFLLLLIRKDKKAESDIILIIWFVILFFNVFSFYIIEKQMAGVILVEILDASAFLHGPVLFFYTSAITGNPLKINIKNTLHFSPFVVISILSTGLTNNNWEYLIEFNNVLIFLKFLVALIYIVLSIILIQNYRKKITDVFSFTDQLELKWLSSILWGGIFLLVFGSINLILNHFTSLDIPQYGGKYLNIAYSVSIIFLGYFGFRQTTIFIPSQFKNQMQFIGQTNKDADDKYGKSRLNKEFLESTSKRLIEFMEIEKPYIDNNLTLFILAEQIGISENNLSQVINSKYQINFFDFVNKYRVELVVEKLKKGEHKMSTLLGIAYDSGFNSKASFNRAFKKSTGLTPSEFIKTNLN